MISIHLAICNENPEMVIGTIKGVLQQNYPSFELIVVDNNTTDINLWKPVEQYCKEHPNIRFFHLSNWPYFKSGALNFARKVTAKTAKYIFIIDADYELIPDALSIAVSNMGGRAIVLVQFPQAYLLNSPCHLPILREFDHFFEYYCHKANFCYGALATGTLSLIDKAALDSVGGWPVNSLTEDAELGVRFQSLGFDIQFVKRIIGKGIAPIHQRDFIKQRKRWIYGNVQTLLNFGFTLRSNYSKWISGISQLTAWSNMLGVPILCLVCLILLGPLHSPHTWETTAFLSYLSLWVFAVSKFLQMGLAESHSLLRTAQSFLIHFSSLGIGAFHWWPVLWGRKRPFDKTNKNYLQESYVINLFYPSLHLLLFVMVVSESTAFLQISSFSFFILHTMAILFDCHARNNSFKNLSFTLKHHL